MAYFLALGLAVVAVGLSAAGAGPLWGTLFGAFALRLGISAVLAPIESFLTAGWLHLHLYLFGARRGFQATFRYVSYLGAIWVVYLAVIALSLLKVPFVGLFALLYFLVLSVIAASAVHRITTGRAMAAILVAAVNGALLYYFVVRRILENL